MSETQLFFDAIRAGDLAAVRTLADQDSTLLCGKNAQSQSPVLFSIYNRQKEIRDFLVSRGAVLELHEAAAAGDVARVKELLENDMALAKSYSPDGFPVVALAAVFGNFEAVKYLHAKGADIRRRHQWPHRNCEVAAGKRCGTQLSLLEQLFSSS